ncbi:MAG: hypothetical protein K0R18_1270 [Bacillales bacterium]|jgi:hypothetical protein|nr:hypothetical protein [Bacillales bacterium]
MTVKMRSNKRWTTQEHNLLTTTIKDSLKKGDTLAKAYRTAAFKTGRSVDACKWRWNNIVNSPTTTKKQTTAEIKKLPLRLNSDSRFPNSQNNKSESVSKQAQITTLSDVLESLFGDALNIDTPNWFMPQVSKPTVVKNHDISNMSVYPMAGGASDFTVIDEISKQAYLVCSINKDTYFCSCQTNPFSNSNCRHVQKLRTDKSSNTK